MGVTSSKQQATGATGAAGGVEGAEELHPDPRSPTPDVARTPLGNTTNPKRNITKNADLRKTFENGSSDEKLIHNNPILSAVIKNRLQLYDPRSPTQEFDRTPVVIASKMQDVDDKKALRAKAAEEFNDSVKFENDDDPEHILSNNNEDFVDTVPKNLCEGFFNMTMDDISIKDMDEPLGSSTASQETIEKNTSVNSALTPPTKLLETNFDFVETEEDIGYCQNVEHTKDVIVQSALRKKFEILNDDPRSPSVGIERTPIIVMKSQENLSAESLQESVEEMSDDCLIKALQGTNMDFKQTLNKANEKHSQGLLIYEDDASKNVNVTPKKSKSASNSGSRTPLSCMKNKTEGHMRSKSANTLSDPKKKNIVSKIPKRVSNIPQMQMVQKKLTPVQSGTSLKSVKGGLPMPSQLSLNTVPCHPEGGDCENTPPNSHRDVWDKESSIVL